MLIDSDPPDFDTRRPKARQVFVITAGVVAVLVAVTVSVVGSVFVVGGDDNGSGDEGYGELTEAELAYVIPGSAPWGAGDPCLDADCAGPVTEENLADAIWIKVGEIDAGDDDGSAAGSIPVSIEVVEVLRGRPLEGPLPVQMWGPDLESVRDASSDGHEVWAATGCDGLEVGYLCYWLVVDEDGRFAGIGYGAATLVTGPLARSAAGTGHTDGRGYLMSVIGG